MRQGVTELIELAVLLLPQGRLQQQIPGRIAPEGEFRGQREFGSGFGSLQALLLQALPIALQITDQRVGLDQCDPHRGGRRC